MIRLTLALLLMTPIAIRAQAPTPPTLVFAFELHAEVAPPLVVGDIDAGTRRIVQITGGTFEGLGFKGRVLPGAPIGKSSTRMASASSIPGTPSRPIPGRPSTCRTPACGTRRPT